MIKVSFPRKRGILIPQTGLYGCINSIHVTIRGIADTSFVNSLVHDCIFSKDQKIMLTLKNIKMECYLISFEMVNGKFDLNFASFGRPVFIDYKKKIRN